MTNKPESTEAKERLKQFSKSTKETNMKNIKEKLKTPFIVLVTLFVVAAATVVYNKGVEDGKTQQKAITHEVSVQVASKLSQK